MVAWLETLGVRWYMPGELGEVIPEKNTIALDAFDRTVTPDFNLRAWFWYNYGRRVQLILDELYALDELHRMQREQAKIGDVRKNAPHQSDIAGWDRI